MYFNSKSDNEKDNFHKDPKSVALKYLEHRDRTISEMRKYLESKGYLTDEIKDTIEYLTDMNYLCDESYVNKYIDYATSKGKGLFKIKHELTQKGVDSDLINEILNDSEILNIQNEKQRAMSEALKILRGVEISSCSDSNDEYECRTEKYKEIQRVKAKVARRLNSLGYSNQVIFSIINDLMDYEVD